MSSGQRVVSISAERRRFPRVAITVPVQLKRSRCSTVTGLLHNLSPGGMQVRLSAQAAAALLPKRSELKPNVSFSIHASFLIPLKKTRVAIAVKSTVVHVSVVDAAPAAARIAIGFRFERFKNLETLRRFVMFLEEQMVPMEDYELYLYGRRRLARPPPVTVD